MRAATAQFIDIGLPKRANTIVAPFHTSQYFLVVRRPLFHIAKTERETNIRLVLVLVVLLAFPYVHTALISVPVFIAYYTALAMFALLTACLLFGQFLIV